MMSVCQREIEATRKGSMAKEETIQIKYFKDEIK
jgi:hypothetical protein